MAEKLSGVELIGLERLEQIHKHGFDVKNDQYYSHNELIQAAEFCLDPMNKPWPSGWDEHFRLKILAKSRKEQLIVAGAFCAADIDRRQELARDIHDEISGPGN